MQALALVDRGACRTLMPGEKLAIVVKGFPRLSETFVARELVALEARGISFTLHALRAPGADCGLVKHDVKAVPQYLPEYLHEQPSAVAAAVLTAAQRPNFVTAWRKFRLDLGSKFTQARIRRFGQACVLAVQLPESVRHIHAHFAHSPGSVARYAACLRGLSYSVSAHAKDIWTAPDWDLRHKLDDAAFFTVCNRAGFERLNDLQSSGTLHLIHHGVPRALIVAAPRFQSRDGSRHDDPVRIVAVARAVDKKGLRLLLGALKQIPNSLAFRLDHYGGGELLDELKQVTRKLGLEARVTWHGAVAHSVIIEALDQSDLFVMANRVSGDGDRDGIPNALLEAQARGVCVLASRAGSVDEAVTDGHSGRLVEPGDEDALLQNLSALVRNPEERFAFAAAAITQRRQTFDAEAGYDEIARLLNERMQA